MSDLDLGVGGISYIELAHSCMSFGLVRGLSLRTGSSSLSSVQVAQFQCRLFLLVQALIFGDPVVLLATLMRSLCLIPGGLRRFVPCSIGANHCRLRHIGWEKCGHGLTSGPRESASELFLNARSSWCRGRAVSRVFFRTFLHSKKVKIPRTLAHGLDELSWLGAPFGCGTDGSTDFVGYDMG